jgi:hypothetical protein
MKTKQVLTLTVLVLVACSLAMLGGCKKDEPADVGVNVETAKIEVVNAKCPIMGNPIDPTAVPANLVREFDGHKIGFCCAACPEAWDKLSDAEKTAKLADAK